MDVRRRADSFGDRLRELEILGVEVPPLVRSGHDEHADPVAVRLDRHRDQRQLVHRARGFRVCGAASEVDDGVRLHVSEEQRPSDLEHRSRNAFARVIRLAAEVIAETLRRSAVGATELMPTMCSSPEPDE